MKKVLNIGWKDLVITFRDRAALIMMLAAPFVLTLGLGLVTGSFSDDNDTGISDIPVVIVNQDEGEMGAFLEEVLLSEELATLVEPMVMADVSSARRQVDGDEAAAVVIIPAGFSAGILPDRQTGATGDAAPIEVYANPARPISASAIEAIVTTFVNQVETGILSGQVAITQLIASSRLSAAAAPAAAEVMADGLAGQELPQLISLNRENAALNQTETFDPLALLAPAMAVFFLMYTVTLGGRSILDEKNKGTLSRMLVTPTTAAQVMGGKVLGTFLSGVTQVSILIVASALLFGLRWGNSLAVALLIVAVSAAATGWGILLAALARSANQVSTIGTAMMLIFNILGGGFIPLSGFPAALQWASKITPNAWAQAGFLELGLGRGLADVVTPIAALWLMAAILFGLSVIAFRRRWPALI
jgi:ABC-2 type transport system permease protein